MPVDENFDEPVQCRQTDSLDPAHATALLATLGSSKTLGCGDPLPHFFHHVYFWEALPPGELGRDGHPRVGQGLIPDMGLPRRMWAGGRLTFHAPLVAGVLTEKISTRERAEQKVGRTGALGFVHLRHEFRQAGKLCVSERQDLVYRQDPDPTAPVRAVPDAPNMAEMSCVHEFDTTLLFRYSALTFNGHRIHYDLDYAQSVEGYDGLVVHGPLLAQLLLLWAGESIDDIAVFEFRGVSPLMHSEIATFGRTGRKLWVAGADGRLVMTASI